MKLQTADGEFAGQSMRGVARGKKGKSIQDNPLISRLHSVADDLKSCEDIRTF